MGGVGSLFGVLGIVGVFVMRSGICKPHLGSIACGAIWIPAAHLLGSLAIFVYPLMVKTRDSIFGLVIVSCAIPVYFWRRRTIANFAASDLETPIGLRPAFAATNQSETV